MKNSEEKNKVNKPEVSYNKPLNSDQNWQLLSETEKQMKETDEQIKAIVNIFTSPWGRLIELLVDGTLLRLLNERNIPVHCTMQRSKGNYKGTRYEFDIIAVNGNEIVIVEVKDKLRQGDVKEFIKKLKNAKKWMQEYKNKIIYGAMAFLAEKTGSAVMAQKHGLFIIKATENIAFLVNDKDFKPREY